MLHATYEDVWMTGLYMQAHRCIVHMGLSGFCMFELAHSYWINSGYKISVTRQPTSLIGQGWHYHWDVAIAEPKSCCIHSGNLKGLPCQSSESCCHTMSVQNCGETQFQKRNRCLCLNRDMHQLWRIIFKVHAQVAKKSLHKLSMFNWAQKKILFFKVWNKIFKNADVI